MKLAFISDIHGNATALEAVIEDIQKREVDKVYVLGDICYRGPEPKQSLELVQELHADVIKGNADEWVVRGVKEGEVPNHALEIMTKERDWTYSRLDEADIDYLQSLPSELRLEYGNRKIHAFHATPTSLFDVVLPDVDDEVLIEKMMASDADLFIYAHIHKPYIRYIKGKCIINLGSVGLPFDGLTNASYALVEIEEDHFQTSIVRVGYDVEKVIKQFRESDYPNAPFMANALSNGQI